MKKILIVALGIFVLLFGLEGCSQEFMDYAAGQTILAIGGEYAGSHYGHERGENPHHIYGKCGRLVY